jgi:hypothetical protein
MAASRLLGKLGVNINPQKTRIVLGEHSGVDKTGEPRCAWFLRTVLERRVAAPSGVRSNLL